MPSSTVSLEPLSSPSPSPPPPEDHIPDPSHTGGAAGLDSGSELSELTEDEQEDSRGDDGNEVRSTSRTREARRKRGGLVPAPMWDWAYKNNKKGDWRSRPVEPEEEEEEEQSGPVKAMEEEEEDDDQELSVSRLDDQPLSDNEGEDEHDDDDALDDVDADCTLTAIPPRRMAREDDSANEDEDEDEGEGVASAAPSQAPSRKGGASPEMSDEEIIEDEEPEDEAGDEDIAADDDAPVIESEGEDEPEPPATGDPPTPADVTPRVLDATSTLMDVDDSARPTLITAPLAGSSIMAGSAVVDIPSPSPSSSTSGSPSSSRSASPEPDADVQSEREEVPVPTRKVSTRNRKPRGRARTSRKSKAGDQDPEADVDPDNATAPDPDEGDVADADDGEPESPEMELESDLQPAHRAEALDVLATIELKFALLRERLYVEKMENLAWEETLVAEGTHPEMLHLHAELSKRRDKRLELASRRRDYEIANVTKRRKLDEDGVWSWWKFERDELQTEMISETNRKRRKLERERRALERPQPDRLIPKAPQDIQPPPTLREIVKSYPFGAASTYNTRHSERVNPASLEYPSLSALSPPQIARDLETLYFYRRTAGFDHHRPPMMNAQLYDYPMNMAMVDGPGPGNRFGPGMHPFPHQQQPTIYSQMQGPPPPMMQGFPAQPPRLPHHHSAPAGSLPNFHPSQVLDQDMPALHAPSGPHTQQFAASMAGPANLRRRSISPVPVQALSNGPGPGMPIVMGASPMPPGFAGPKPNGWAGVGPPGPSSMSMSAKEPRRPNSVVEGHEGERERGRYLDGLTPRDVGEREHDGEREREHFHMQAMQQRHQPHQHTDRPLHMVQGQSAHTHLGQHYHHHHHHHHHVHHHHHPQQQNGLHPAPMGALPGSAGTGTGLSPHGPREIEPRRVHSGTPTEVIDLSAGPSKQPAASPRMSSWKGKDEPLPPSDPHRDRGRQPLGPPPVGPHERMIAPMMVGPGQTGSGYPGGSPRNGPPATAPSSVGPSRRGSWSAADESSHPRPSSSASTSGHSHRQSLSRMHRPITPQPGQWGPGMNNPDARSPPLNGLTPSNMSPASSGPAFPGGLLSPTRPGQSLQLPPPPSLTSVGHSPPVHSSTPPLNGSPGLKLFGRVPPSPGTSKSALPRSAAVNPEAQYGGGGALPPPLSVVNIRTSSPLSLFPSSNAPHPSRMSNGSISETHLGSGPVAPKAVPVDGSS